MVMAVAMWCMREGGQLGVAVGYEDGAIGLWDLRMLSQPLTRLKFFDEPVLSLAIDSDGKGGVVGAATDRVAVFALRSRNGIESLKLKRKVQVKEEGINSVAIRRDRRIFATGGWDGKARLWDYKKCEPLAVLKYHSKEVADVDYRSRDGMLVTASRDTTLALWSVYLNQAEG